MSYTSTVRHNIIYLLLLPYNFIFKFKFLDLNKSHKIWIQMQKYKNLSMRCIFLCLFICYLINIIPLFEYAQIEEIQLISKGSIDSPIH
jgi:hypothetical protein